MPTLTRQVGDRITIDGGITIVVLGIVSGRVRLGIDAPSEVEIWREEIVNKETDE